MMEPADDTFRLFHRYNKLVRRELANPLVCGRCDAALVTGVDSHGGLILKCYACNSIITPGYGTLSDIKAIVTEHFLDD